MGARAPSRKHAWHCFGGQYSGMRLENVNRSSLRVPRYAFQTLAWWLGRVHARSAGPLPIMRAVPPGLRGAIGDPRDTSAAGRRYSQPIRCVNVTPNAAIRRGLPPWRRVRGAGGQNDQEDGWKARLLRLQRKVREKPLLPLLKRVASAAQSPRSRVTAPNSLDWLRSNLSPSGTYPLKAAEPKAGTGGAEPLASVQVVQITCRGDAPPPFSCV